MMTFLFILAINWSFFPPDFSIISCEEGMPLDQFQPVDELLALIADFTLLGKAELKVALCVPNPQPAGFKFDPPLTKGWSGFSKTFSIVILLPTPSYYLCLFHEDKL